MAHLPAPILDLGWILITAAVVTLVFRVLRQPVVLGYLVAGFLVSHHVPFLPTVSDTESVKIWAEVGVIFLLFGLGLEFSFKKLAQVGRSASITAVVEVFGMLSLGYLAGRGLGWSKMDSLFLGGILSISSTTIIVRAFGELGLRGKKFVHLVFGVLIVEDLVAILLLVLLSTIAATDALSGTELLMSGLRLAFFLVLWFIVGIYLIPALLRRIRPHLSDETTLIVSLGLCLLMVILATNAGFSAALGAFVMGSLLAETREGKNIEHLLAPVRDLFGAVFFVSVGMLIDPAMLREHFGVILLMTGLTIAGKFLTTGLGALLSGETLKTSVQAGMSLAQIGEFSFIIATLGLTLGVTSDFLYPIAVSVSAITTFTTPYLIRLSGTSYEKLAHLIPAGLQERLANYHRTMAEPAEQGRIGLVWRAYGAKILLNSIVVVAIALAAKKILLPKLVTMFPDWSWMALATGLGALAISTPFLWAIASGPAARSAVSVPENARALQSLNIGLFTVRWTFAVVLAALCINLFTSPSIASVAALIVVGGILFLNRHRARDVYHAVENRFIANLRDNEERAKPGVPELAPWDATLTEFVLSPHSELVAKTLQESKLKERFGVTLAMIERGGKQILAPGRSDILLPQDRLYFIGNEEQLAAVGQVVERSVVEQEGVATADYGLEAIRIKSGSPFLAAPIRDSGIREAVQGLIVGIERKGRRILSPDSSLRLEDGDLVWLVGNRKKIQELGRA